MTSDEIRKQFLDFFAEKKHRIVPSGPVVPFNDPTLLFTNAGMNQFKDVFLGKGKRDYIRAADTQKCIRVSGKHNDLEAVGNDIYHHTFFEMLGNWSFGDYYKGEAIGWAWELLTDVWKLPKERLWATVYRTDNEAFEFWKTKTDIDHEHILRFDDKDNFWVMGDTGPCGPCSEIHINLGSDYNNPEYVNAGTSECIEIWNLVFIQYDRDEKGELHDLPLKHIDTGMGFERICAVLQHKESNYDTDIFMPLINRISEISGVKYEKEADKIPMRVIADHIRALSFAIADGAVPGNEGRGYVLRRILRRASRYGRKLSLHRPFLYEIVDVLVAKMGHVFPELIDKKNYIKKVIRAEEESFNLTLDRGIDLFEELIRGLQKENLKIIPGEAVFKLYDTYGFPVDLTNIMAGEKGFSIDEEGFKQLMELQQRRGRQASKEKLASINISADDLSSFDLFNPGSSEFTGYDELVSKGKIIGYKKDKEHDLVILDRSPFYVEAGGQIDDEGQLIIEETVLPVVDVAKIDNKTIHVIENENKELITPGKDVIARVDEKRRWDIMRNHTATHFLHAALRKVLGNHVHQAGSYVGPDRLRFDFTHFSRLSEVEIKEIESLVNDQLRRNLPSQHHRNIPFEEAKKMGALMFFGDKYGDKVNVVQFGDFTKEFCGGTHVKNSSEIGLFKIVSESSIASGVRRIEAVTGRGVEEYIESQIIRLKESDERASLLLEEKKRLEKDFSELKLKEKLGQVDELLKNPVRFNNISIYKGEVNAESMDELKSFGDELRNKTKESVGVIISRIEDKVGIVCVVTDELVKSTKLSAGRIVGALAKIAGGGGGGKAHLATAGGRDISKIPEVLNEVEKTVQDFL